MPAVAHRTTSSTLSSSSPMRSITQRTSSVTSSTPSTTRLIDHKLSNTTVAGVDFPKPSKITAVEEQADLQETPQQHSSPKMLKALVKHFVFGYGSLICKHSRAITAPEQAYKVATPVVVRNVERIWSKRTNRGMTAMGVRFVPQAECVGVLLPVSESELKRFDEREMGYRRVPLVLDDVDLVPFLGKDHYDKDEGHKVFVKAKQGLMQGKKATDHVKVWMYVQEKPLPPSPEHPIVQTYVDTILRGCLSISEEFAKEFIENTKGWHPDELKSVDARSEDSVVEMADVDDGSVGENDSDHGMDLDRDLFEDSLQTFWVNDRHRPVYIRGDPNWSRKKADELDRLLRKYRPQHFARRKKLPVVTKQPKE